MSGAPPSPGLRRVAGGVYGGFLLGRGRADGMAVIDTSPAGAWASFASMWICAPGYLALRLLSGISLGEDAPRALLAEAIGYVIDWFAFPLLMHGVTDGMGRRGRYCGFVAAWNWASVPQVLAALVAAALGALPSVTAPVAGLFGLLAFGYTVWVGWFVARTALGVPGPKAAFVVAAGVVLGLFIDGVTLTLAQG